LGFETVPSVKLNAKESLCSLRFASQVNKCELGKAKSSVEYLSDDEGIATSNGDTSVKKRPGCPVGSAARNVKARGTK
jgi:hypothetical protein